MRLELQYLVQSQKNNNNILATMKQTSKSLEKECAAFGYSSRSYCFVNKERKPTGISFFKFPKSKAEINDWCTLIKRQNGKDGFLRSKKIQHIYARNIFMLQIYTEPLVVHDTP